MTRTGGFYMLHSSTVC